MAHLLKTKEPLACIEEKSSTILAENRTLTRPLGLTFRLLYGMASIITGLCNVTIKQLLLPLQVADLDPTHRFTSFALIASMGALAGVVISPLSGALSDHTVGRWGRRRPWIVAGGILALIGLYIMAQSTTILQLLFGEVIVQIAVDTIMAAMTAIIPDQIPPQQRALASALIGMSPIVGGLVGLLLVTHFVDLTHTPQQGYLVLAVASCFFLLPFLLVFHDAPITRDTLPRFQLKSFLASFWINPRRYPDFGYTLLSRCLMFLGYTILISYLLYYLQDVLHMANADKGVALFQLISTLTLVISALVSGNRADKTQRLKPFICWAALLMTLALLLISLLPTWPGMVIAAILLGAGLGSYLSVDIALAVRVLPSNQSSGKDLGIINTAIFIPLIISPLIGAGILNYFHSYILLFALAALFFAVAGLLVLPIKGLK